MNTIRISATAARNRFFDLLNQVAAGAQVIIEKDKKEKYEDYLRRKQAYLDAQAAKKSSGEQAV